MKEDGSFGTYYFPECKFCTALGKPRGAVRISDTRKIAELRRQFCCGDAEDEFMRYVNG